MLLNCKCEAFKEVPCTFSSVTRLLIVVTSQMLICSNSTEIIQEHGVKYFEVSNEIARAKS